MPSAALSPQKAPQRLSFNHFKEYCVHLHIRGTPEEESVERRCLGGLEGNASSQFILLYGVAG